MHKYVEESCAYEIMFTVLLFVITVTMDFMQLYVADNIFVRSSLSYYRVTTAQRIRSAKCARFQTVLVLPSAADMSKIRSSFYSYSVTLAYVGAKKLCEWSKGFAYTGKNRPNREVRNE